GEARYNVMQMARDWLAVTLRPTIAKARDGAVPIRATGVEFQDNGAPRTCDVVVIPLAGATSERDATKEYLQTILAEHGRTNDDLATANEELVSGNEELQSMNEELETAKEE